MISERAANDRHCYILSLLLSPRVQYKRAECTIGINHGIIRRPIHDRRAYLPLNV